MLANGASKQGKEETCTAFSDYPVRATAGFRKGLNPRVTVYSNAWEVRLSIPTP